MLLKTGTARKLHQNESRVLCANGAYTVVPRPELIQDKQGVVVKSIPTSDENGVIEQRFQSGSISDVTLMIKNNGRTSVTVKHITLLWSVQFFDYSDIATIDEYRAVIEPGMHLFHCGTEPATMGFRLGLGWWGRGRGWGWGVRAFPSLYPPRSPSELDEDWLRYQWAEGYAVSSGSRNGIQWK